MTLALDLRGRKGLVLGIANTQSLAYGCARAYSLAGAELVVTYQNDKAKPFVEPVAQELGAAMLLPCDVQNEREMAELFRHIAKRWGKLDFLLHSIAYAPKTDLQGRVVDCSLAGFLTAMDISCHSFLRLAKLAEPLMREGGSLLTMSFMGSKEVVPHYNVMGPVKAALEASVRYLAAELGPSRIRVNALSPGAMRTRAAGGLAAFEEILEHSAGKAPLHRLVDLADVGYMAAFLASDAAKNITGGIHAIDAGYEVMD